MKYVLLILLSYLRKCCGPRFWPLRKCHPALLKDGIVLPVTSMEVMLLHCALNAGAKCF